MLGQYDRLRRVLAGALLAAGVVAPNTTGAQTREHRGRRE